MAPATYQSLLSELLMVLQRPPFYPKLSLLSRLLTQLGSTYVVVNSSLEPGWSQPLLDALDVLNLPSLSFRGTLAEFYVIWGVLLFFLLITVGIAFVCADRFHRSLYTPPLLIKFLRACLGTIGSFSAPLFSLFLAFADCDYGDYSQYPGQNSHFDFVCLDSSWADICFVLSAVVAFAFSSVAVVQAFFHPSDPHSPSIVHRAHSRIEAATIASNHFLIVLGILLRRYRIVFALCYMFMQFVLLGAWLLLQPFFNSVIQDLQAGIAAIPCWASICFFILRLGDETTTKSRAMSLLLVVGVVPACVAVSLLSAIVRKHVIKRARWLVIGVPDDAAAYAQAIESYDPNAALGVLNSLRAFSIEIAARFALGPDDVGIVAACTIIRRGVIRYPQSEYLRMQYISYLLRAKSQTEAATAVIQSCEKLNVDTEQAVRLQLLKREAALQIRARQTQSNGVMGNGTEALNEAELKQRLNDARAMHFRCQQLMGGAWGILHKEFLREDKNSKKRMRKEKAANKLLGKNKANGKQMMMMSEDEGATKPKTSKFANLADVDGKPRKKSPTGNNNNNDNDGNYDGDDIEQQRGIGGGASNNNSNNNSTALVNQPGGSSSASVDMVALLAEETFASVLTNLEKLREEEKRADAAFLFLITQCPESPEVLQEYASYIRNVKLDESTARDLETRRDMAIVTKEKAAKKDFARNLSMNEESGAEENSDASSEGGKGSATGSETMSGSDVSDTPRAKATPIIAPSSRLGVGRGGGGGGDLMFTGSDDGGSVSSGSRDDKKNGDGSSDGSGGRDGAGGDDDRDFNLGVAAAVEQRSRTMEGSSSHSSDPSNRLPAELQAEKDRQDLLSAVSDRMSFLTFRLRLSTLLLLGLASGLLWVFVSLAKDAEVATTDADFQGRCRFGVPELGYQSRRMHVGVLEGDNALFTDAQKKIFSISAQMTDITALLAHERSVWTTALRSFYDDGQVKVREVRGAIGGGTNGVGGTPIIEELTMSGSQVIERMIACGLVVAGSNTTTFASYNRSNPASFPEFFFIIDNVYPIVKTMDTGTILIVKEVDHIVFLCMLLIGLLSGVALVVEIMIVFGLFRPSVRDLFAELGATVHRLGCLTRAERAAMASRFKAMQEMAATEALNDMSEHRVLKKGGKNDLDNLDAELEEQERQKMKMHGNASPRGDLTDDEDHYPARSSGAGTPVSPAIRAMGGARRSMPSNVRFASDDDDDEDIVDAGEGSPPSPSGTLPMSPVRLGSPPSSPPGKEKRSPARRSSFSKKQNGVKLISNTNSNSNIHNSNSTGSTAVGKIAPTTVSIVSEKTPIEKFNVNNKKGAGNGTFVRKGAEEIIPSNPIGDGGGGDFFEESFSDDSGNENNNNGKNKKKSALKSDPMAVMPVSSRRKRSNSTSSRTGKNGKGGLAHNAQGENKLGTKMSKESMERKRKLELWYIICLITVATALITVFALGFSSSQALSEAARWMNNIGRKRSLMRCMSFTTFDFLRCYNPKTGLCGGVQRFTVNEDSMRCFLKELIVATSQVHEADLHGKAGWFECGRGFETKTDYNTPCSVLTPRQDLYETAIELGLGAVQTDSRMNTFIFVRGYCLASLGDLASISALYENDRTAAEMAKFSDNKCVYFQKGDKQMMMGLHRILDEIMYYFRIVAEFPIMTDSGPVVPNEAFDFIAKYSQSTDEWAFGLLKGAMLMEAQIFERTATNTRVVSSAYAVLVFVSLLQLVWLGSRIHTATKDNLFVSILVERMLRAGSVQYQQKLAKTGMTSKIPGASATIGLGSTGVTSTRNSKKGTGF